MSDPLLGVRHNGRHSPLVSTPNGGTIVARPVPDVKLFQDAAMSSNTRRNYQSDWQAFESWCQANRRVSLPAEPVTVAEFIAFHANLIDGTGQWFYSPSTIRRWLASINKAHELTNLARPGAHPEVSTTMAGIKLERSRPVAKKEALLLDELTRVLSTLDLNCWPGGVIAQRDYALILLGFAGAFRRSELADLQIHDVRIREDGLHVTMADQEREGHIKVIPFGMNAETCPPCAYVRWLRILEADREGRSQVKAAVVAADVSKHVCRDELPTVPTYALRDAVLRPVMKNAAIKNRHISGHVVNSVVQRRLEALGLRASVYGGHSLRSGFIMQSLRDGATYQEVMRQTGHASADAVDGYTGGAVSDRIDI